MERVTQRRVARGILRAQHYLRRHLPPDFQKLSDAELHSIASDARRSGRALGIRTAAGHLRWAYLNAITEGRVATNDQVTGFIRDGDGLPDVQVKTAMTETLAHLKRVAEEIAS